MRFHCNEKYVTGHRCKNQRAFVLEVEQDVKEELEWGFERKQEVNETSPIEIYANAMAGVLGVNAIRLVGRIMGKEVGFLVDTEATHNFIDTLIMERLQLTDTPINTFVVTVTRGEKIEGEKHCRGVKLNIQGVNMEANLLVVPLGDLQVILGTVWLQDLGLTLWDFRKRTLKF